LAALAGWQPLVREVSGTRRPRANSRKDEFRSRGVRARADDCDHKASTVSKSKPAARAFGRDRRA
jgi:hypothetical protein